MFFKDTIKTYWVKASIPDPQEKSGLRPIWHFHAIPSKTKYRAISDCKYLMKSKMGTIGDYTWSAGPEWEDCMEVN